MIYEVDSDGEMLSYMIYALKDLHVLKVSGTLRNQFTK